MTHRENLELVWRLRDQFAPPKQFDEEQTIRWAQAVWSKWKPGESFEDFVGRNHELLDKNKEPGRSG